jgi:hypothetical protein
VCAELCGDVVFMLVPAAISFEFAVRFQALPERVCFAIEFFYCCLARLRIRQSKLLYTKAHKHS